MEWVAGRAPHERSALHRGTGARKATRAL